MSHPPPKLHLVAAPEQKPDPARLFRADLNTIVVACASAATLTYALESRHRALLVAHDVAADSFAPGRDLRELLGGLIGYTCDASAPERAAPRYQLDTGTLIRAFAVLSALLVPHYLTRRLRSLVVLAPDERARAWWQAGTELLTDWRPHKPAVEATVEGAARRVAQLQILGETPLVVVDGLSPVVPRWGEAVRELGQACPELPFLGLTLMTHVETFGVRAQMRGLDVAVGVDPEDDYAVWTNIASSGVYILRGATGDPDRRSAS